MDLALRILALFCPLLLPATLSATPLNDDERARLETVLEGLVEEGDPGFAVGIVRDGEVVFEAYDGLSVISNAVPITADTRINVASVAKQYTALMVLDLASQGKVDLSADFRTYLPEAMSKVETPISLSHLITHTSGVRDIHYLMSLRGVTWWERPFSNRYAMRLLNDQVALNFPPGSEYLYSNSNYILLSEVIAAVTKQPFHEYARGFFDRLEMPSSGWKARASSVTPNEARAYNYWNSWMENPQIAYTHGDGYLLTTLPDQMAWEQQLQGASSALSREILTASQMRLDEDLPGGYGYGLEMGSFAGSPSIYHVGSTGGYNAYTLRLPEQNISIVVMVNSSQIGVVDLGNRLAAGLLEVPVEEIGSNPAGPEVVLARPQNADVLGRYEVDSGSIITITQQDGVLYRELEGSEPAALLHREGNVFEYSTIPGLMIAFDRTAAGKKRFRLFLPTQGVQSALELPLPQTDDASKAELEGCFYNAETRTEIVMEWAGENSFRMIKNGRPRDATLIGRDYLSWNSYRFRYARDGAGAVTGFRVDIDRIRNVLFEPWDECRGEKLGRFAPL
ncbi:MAG: serine hydrolase domain-containing protein [Pseudomonadota bacterium]